MNICNVEYIRKTGKTVMFAVKDFVEVNLQSQKS